MRKSGVVSMIFLTLGPSQIYSHLGNVTQISELMVYQLYSRIGQNCVTLGV